MNQAKLKVSENQQAELLQRVQVLVEDYLRVSDDPRTPVVDYCAPEDLADRFDFSLPERGEGEEALPDLVQAYLDGSVHTGSPRFFNQLFGGFLLPGYVGDQIAALTNTSMYTYECAPMATLMEKALMQEMARHVGFDQGEGLLVTGGSNANLVAMSAARHAFDPSIKTQGFQGQRPLVIFVSDQAHYSFAKGAALMGLGTEQVIPVASDRLGAMDPASLSAAIAEARRQGQQPFFVGATAGTTVLGAFDPIKAIAEICDSEGLWLHIDGSWGGSVALVPELAELIEGSHQAQSFTWNPHKMMGIPLPCSAILFRSPGTLAELHGVPGTDYIFHGEAAGPDLGPLSLQCGRRVDALKLWLAWRCLGTEGFRQRILRLFDLCARARARVLNEPRLQLVREPSSVNLVFRYLPPGLEGQAIDEANVSLREDLCRRGLALVNYATVDGRQVFRLVFANADQQPADVKRFFDDLLERAEALFGSQGV